MKRGSWIARVGGGVPADAKDVRHLDPVRVAAGDGGDHHGTRAQSEIQNPKSKIG